MEYNKIYSTADYSKFKFIIGNRNINRAHVEKLKEDIVRNGLRMPVLVDMNFNITDGQHRFTAAKELGIPIRYMLDPKRTASPDDIRELNSTSKNWTTKDCVNSFADTGNINYKNFLTLNKKYPGISDTSILGIILGRIEKHDLKILKNGSLKLPIKLMNQLFPVLDFIQDNISSINKMEGRKYIIMSCVGWCLRFTDCNKERLLKVIENPTVLPAAADGAAIRFLEALSKEYNKGLSKPKRIQFDVVYKLIQD